MNKKNTIIIAVLINAVLLTLLFVTASSHEEEYYAKAHIPQSPVIDKPLEALNLEPVHELPTPKSEESPVPIPIASLPEPTKEPQSENKLVYSLPEVAKESVAIATPAVIPNPAPASSKLREVIVKKGDSLDKIARAHKVSLDEIVKINHLPNSFLKIGQVLKIPESSSKPSTPKVEAKETQGQFYVVKAGDNPWTIAMKHHMKVEELLRLNHLDKEKAKKIKPGDKLKVK